MQLLKLEAYGFKSFADKLNIEFGKGITAIVGPNGSGKSNITDAIRWVLGEQNVRNLRGAKTEDVIFSGSAQRRRLGIAEVVLSFDNSDGELPLEFSEVSVTRRIFRSGDSEYFINNVPCRLKDIHALFADTGLGRDGMSVISQNNVDDVLNNRPEERRLLFEEAAGITKYRTRKREALKKLDDTEQNLLRVNDIINEIAANIEELSASAERTRRYNALNEKFQRAKLSLIVNRYDKYALLSEEAARKSKAINEELALNDAKIQSGEVEKMQLAAELDEVESALGVLAAKNRTIAADMEKSSSRLAVLDERIRQSEIEKARLTASLVELSARQQQDGEKIKSNAAKLKELGEKIADASSLLNEEAAKLASADESINLAKAELDEYNAARMSNLRRNVQLESNIKSHKIKLKELTESLASDEREKTVATEKFSQAKQNLFTLKKDADEMSASFAAEGQELKELKEKLNEIGGKRQAAEQAKSAAYNELFEKKHRLKILQALQGEYEGFGRAAKAVLRAKKIWRKNVCGVVAELIDVPKEYITAIETALGGSMQNIVVEDEQTAKLAIEFLKKNRLGRATFLPLTTLKPPVDSKKFDKYDGFLGSAASLVTCADKYRTAVEFLLKRTAVVTDIDAAINLARDERYRVRIVTLQGELINVGGSFTGGSREKREASFFGRADEILKLKDDVAKRQERLIECEADQSALAGIAALLEKKLNESESSCRRLEMAAAAARLKAEQAEKAAGDLELKQQSAAAQTKDTQAKIDSISCALKNMQKSLADFSRTRDDAPDLETKLKEQEKERGRINARLTDLKIKKSALLQEQGFLKEKDGEDKKALADRLKRREAAEAELKKSRTLAYECQKEADALKKENKHLSDLKAVGEKDYANFQSVRLNKLSDRQNCDTLLQELRKTGGALRARLHENELAAAKYAVVLEQFAEKLMAEYSLSIEQARQGRMAGGDEMLESESEELERAIKSLGAVNPGAIEEFERASQRQEFLSAQANDLVKSKEYLNGIIADIDVEMAKRFKNAFNEINSHFKAIFARLFGGGAAELKMTDKDGILSAGIEINVQPPGKKMNGLAVLSGGERALTVIALLFAVLQYKPSPFIVVDEIDAPLDESNVARFAGYLKEYAENTQFIIVTHRKGTMEAADVLHGVTATEGGVSRIVSVRLEDADA
jgi:chromosome segregation protein